MNKYFLFSIIMIFGYLMLNSINSYRVEIVQDRLVYRVKPFYAFLYILPLIIFATMRDLSFGDTSAYISGFNSIPIVLSDFVNYLQLYPKDPGFTVLSWLVKLIGFNAQGFLFLLASYQAFVLMFVFRKYSSNYYLSILFFVLSTDYFSWMFNGLRQFMAVTIVFSGFLFFLNKSYIRLLLLIMFASLFHQSVLIMIPFIFVVNGKALSKRILLIYFLATLSLVFLSSFTNVLDNVLQNTQYENVVTDYTTGDFSADNGTNPVRVLFYSIPFLLAVVGLRFIRNDNNQIINISTNMSAITTIIYFISIFTSGIFFGRLPIYFSLYNYILLPWEIKNLFIKKQTVFVLFLIIILFSLFYLVQMKYAWMLM